MAQKSFRDRVKDRAISKTWKTARAHVGQSVGILAIVTIFTLLGTVAAKGGSAAWGEAQTYLVAIGANAAAILLMFGWNLWLAPYELVMEEIGTIRDAIKTAPLGASPVPPPPRPKPEINWEIWRQMPQYTALEFAAILARKDPVAGTLTNDVASYLRLIQSDMESKKLPYIPVIKHSYTDDYVAAVNEHTPVKREEAIKWAKEKGAGFSVDHIA